MFWNFTRFECNKTYYSSLINIILFSFYHLLLIIYEFYTSNMALGLSVVVNVVGDVGVTTTAGVLSSVVSSV